MIFYIYKTEISSKLLNFQDYMKKMVFSMQTF
jgi:hypothetical protein